ncbi:hypothetical protein GCM10025771_41480 [Niveibacterium umoris]
MFAAAWLGIALAVSPVVIDVRTPEEFATGHVEGALNLPHDQVATKITALVPSKDAPVVLYCRSGRRADIALKTMREMGYTKVENYGGFEDAKARLSKP